MYSHKKECIYLTFINKASNTSCEYDNWVLKNPVRCPKVVPKV